MNNRTIAYRIALLTVLATMAAAFTGCRTTEGFGEDLQKLGRKIENKSEEVQHGY